MKVFDAYSQYYDLLYRDKDYKAETAYVHSLITDFSTASQTILELGCGTGIHACRLAELGYSVTGIDRSISMLESADKRKSAMPDIASKIFFQEGDIRTYNTPQKFDVVISLFHVMSYLETDNDLQQAMQTAAKHLKKDGLFIFDCWHGPAVLADRPVSRKKSFEDDAIRVSRISIPEMKEEINTVNVKFDITIENKQSGTKDHLEEMHNMRYLFPQEITSLAAANNMEILRTGEWLTKQPLSDSTWNACYVCKNK